MNSKTKTITTNSLCFFLMLLAVRPLSALEIRWVDWTDTTAVSGPAIVTGEGNSLGETITVTYQGSVHFVQLGTGTDYFNPSLPYTDNPVVDNRPPAAEMIAILGGPNALTHTVTFSEPVVDPVMAIVSLGRTTVTVTYEFVDETFEILSSGTGFFGGAEPDSLFEVTPSVLTGVEGHGVIQFSGTYSSISWTVPVTEEWHGFTFGFAVLASQDTDGDSIPDESDNCTEVPNPDQRDTNGDGYGNLCDADLNNDGIINFLDLNFFRIAFFTTPQQPDWNEDADLNGDDVINFLDLFIAQASFFGPPGPSGL